MKARSSQLVAPSSQPPASNSQPPDGGPPRAAAPSPAETEFEAAVVELFAQAADTLGIPKSVTAIYAVIFASPRPLSFADVEERLQLSKGSVSQGLRVLRDVGAIRAVDANEQSGKGKAQSEVSKGQGGVSEEQSGKGKVQSRAAAPSAADSRLTALRLSLNSGDAAGGNSTRRDYYIPNLELRRLVARLLKNKIEPQLAGGSRRLTSLVESVPFADPAAAELVRGRLKHLQTWQRKARKLVPFAKTLLLLGQD